MDLVSLKTLVRDRAKYLGMLVGPTFVSLFVTREAAIFVGLMSRMYGFVTNTSLPRHLGHESEGAVHK